MPTSHRNLLSLIKNSLFASGGWTITAIVGFATTPYMVYRLSVEGYGAYALLTSLAGYYGILDLGLGQGIVKFVAEYEAKQKWGAVSDSINAALVLQSTMGLLGSILIAIFAEPILHLLNIKGELFISARTSMYLAAGTFLVTMLAGTLNSVLAGLQRYAIISVLGNGSITATAILSVVALSVGGGLVACVAISAVTSVTLLCLAAWQVHKALAAWRFSLKIDWRVLRSILSFSVFVFITKVSDTINNYIGRFLVGALLGPVAVTFYMVPSKIINAAWGVLGSGISVILPFASQVQGRSDHDYARKLCLRASSVFAAIATPLFCSILLLAPWLLKVWMGEPFATNAKVVLSLMGVSGITASITSVPIQLALGFGKSRTIALFGLMTLVVYVGSLMVLVPFLGVNGAALALIVATLPGFGLVSVVVRHHFGIPLQDFAWTVYGWQLPIVVLTIGLWCMRTWTGFLPSAVDLPASLVLIVIYFVVVHRRGVLPLQDIRRLFLGRQESIGPEEGP